MGVIKRVPRLPADPFASDNEALNDVITAVQDDNQSTTSEVQSVEHLNLSRYRASRHPRVRVPAIPVNTAPAPKRSSHGAKKSRRYENLLVLLRESDEDEYNNEVSIEDLAPVIQSARTFSRVLRENSMMELWNTFVDCKEELSGSAVHGHGSKANGQRNIPNSNIDPVQAFQGICRKLRTMLKRSPGLGILDSLEEGLLEFFRNQPMDIYHCGPLDGYRRGLLHAISQYNQLESYSVGNKKTEKVVVVKNKQAEFRTPSVRLVSFIENKIIGEPENGKI